MRRVVSAWLWLALAMPTTAHAADPCGNTRPFWSPGTVSNGWDELVQLALTGPGLVALGTLVLVLIVDTPRAWLANAAIWALVALVILAPALQEDAASLRSAAEGGCIGAPYLPLGLCAAICGASLWRALRRRTAT